MRIFSLAGFIFSVNVFICGNCQVIMPVPPQVTIPPINNSYNHHFNNNLYGKNYWNSNNRFSGEVNVSKMYVYRIRLKNDSVFDAAAKIDVYSKRHFINIKVKGYDRAIVPSQTKSISRYTDKGHQLVGVASDSCWFFLVSSGKVNAYSPLSEMKMKYTTAIQKGDGPIVPLTKENLLKMIGVPSPEVNLLIDRNKLVKALEKYNKEP